MTDDVQQARRDEIEEAAYAMLGEKGYAGTSMQAIARAAKASNETLYNWYGDKKGLMAALIARNAVAMRQSLELPDADPLEQLAEVGPMLLEIVLSRRSVALHRAAAADTSGELGRALSAGMRDSIAPLIRSIIARGPFKRDAAQLTQMYLTLLISDLQVRRITGAMSAPSRAYCEFRAHDALDSFKRIAL